VVTVDNDFARFGDKSYAINKINTVEVREISPHPMGLFAILIGLGSAAAILFGILVLTGGFYEVGMFFLIVGSLMGLYCHHASQRAEIRTYSLVLMTSSSEAQAFTSPNRDEVESLRAKIEQAMMGRLAQE
jgi:hypothetical protein